MRKSYGSLPILILIITLLFSLSACSTKEKTDPVVHKVVYDGDQVINPGNHLLTRAIDEYIRASSSPLNSRYEFVRLDLNSDGRDDGLVMFKTPFERWCNRDGCTMIIFEAHNHYFSKQSEIMPVRGPAIVSQNKSNGWHDIMIRLSGREYNAMNVAMKFNGSSYPPHPESQIKPYSHHNDGKINGVKLFP